MQNGHARREALLTPFASGDFDLSLQSGDSGSESSGCPFSLPLDVLLVSERFLFRGGRAVFDVLPDCAEGAAWTTEPIKSSQKNRLLDGP